MDSTAADALDTTDTGPPPAVAADPAPGPAGAPGYFDLLPDDIREVLLANPPPPPEEERKVEEQDRLLADTYPGEYVAYRDVWDGLTFVRREVLAHAADIGDYWAQLDGYPDAEVETMRVTYYDPLELRDKIVVRERRTLRNDIPE